MKPDDFEKQLQKQPLRTPPPEWRTAILDAAESARPKNRPEPVRFAWWRELLWPSPKAWAALAAVWFTVLAVNFVSTEPGTQARAHTNSATLPPDIMMALQHQRQLRSELLEPQEASSPEQQTGPRPRTQKSPRRTVMEHQFS